jgi:hypothetical protein
VRHRDLCHSSHVPVGQDQESEISKPAAGFLINDY